MAGGRVKAPGEASEPGGRGPKKFKQPAKPATEGESNTNVLSGITCDRACLPVAGARRRGEFYEHGPQARKASPGAFTLPPYRLVELWGVNFTMVNLRYFKPGATIR